MHTLQEILERLPSTRVLVVGDIVLDHYIWGEVHRISPEAPIPVVQVVRETYTLGGAANVAHNLRTLDVAVHLCGVVGNDGHGRMLADLVCERGIDGGAMVVDAGRPTTMKSRVIAHRQQVVRVDREITEQLPDAVVSELKRRVAGLLPQIDAVIVEDYGKGVVNPALLADVVERAREAGKIVTVDPKMDHLQHYRGITAITPNRQEAESVLHTKIKDKDSLYRAGRRLLDLLGCRGVLITLGEQGMCLFEDGVAPFEIPTQAREVYDVSGAGDTVIAVFTAALASGAAMREAARLSNLAGGIVVEKLGTATVTRQEIRARLRELEAEGAMP